MPSACGQARSLCGSSSPDDAPALPGFGNNWLVLLKPRPWSPSSGSMTWCERRRSRRVDQQPFTFYMAVALIFLVFASWSLPRRSVGRASLRHQRRVNGPFLDHSQGGPHYWEGLYTTIWLVAASSCWAHAGLVPMGILRNSRNWLIKGPIWACIYFLPWHPPASGQLFIIYYGAAQWEWLKNSAAWSLFRGLVLCPAGVHSQHQCLHRRDSAGRRDEHAKGQIEAASAFGMTRPAGRPSPRIILPNSFRRALPGLQQRG